jgi:nucleotide-binding universal stress UspA family protein
MTESTAQNVGRPIVVGVDGSDSAREAAEWAAGESVRKRVPLKLVYVVHVPTAAGYVGSGGLSVDLLDDLQAEALRQLTDARAELLRRRADLSVDTAVLVGPPIPTLIEESATAQLMVVGSRGLGGFTGILVGSTAVALAAHGQCPVAVVRGARPTGPVVVGVDGSPASEAAVAVAFEEASLRGAELVALHTWLEHASDAAYVAAIEPVLNWESLQERGEEELAQRLAGWQEKYPDVTVRRSVARGRPVRNLLDLATEAQLLVVGSRGRGGFRGMLLGSTSQALVYHAPCPLIVARG